MGEKNEKESAHAAQQNILKAVIAGIGVYLALRYLLPLVSPFLLSFCIVHVLNPGLERMRKRTHIRKDLLLVGVLVLMLTVILLLLWSVLQFGTLQAAQLAENWDGISVQVGGRFRVFFGDCCMFIEEHLGIDADRVEQVILDRMDVMVEEIRVELLPKLMTESWWYVRKLLAVAAFLGITFIASVLLCKDYTSLLEYVHPQNSSAERGSDARSDRNGAGTGTEKWFEILERILHLAAVFLKTQGLLMLTVAGITSVGLLIGKVNSAVILGILAGVLDALPFIGTGIVLIPTALWQLLIGRYGTAVWCIVIYVLCIAVRELLEPRLMGEKIGIYPVFMLLSVYAGVKLFGISGIIKGPLALVVLMEIGRKKSVANK